MENINTPLQSRRNRNQGVAATIQLDEELVNAIDYKQSEEDIKAQKIAEFEKLESVKLFKGIVKYMDDYYLDPIIGLIPIVGDLIGSLISFFTVYIAIQVRSINLALAMILNSLIDFAVGLIPYLGMVIDFIFKSNRRNYELVIGYVSGDEEVISKINKRAFGTAVGIVIFIYIIYQLIAGVSSMISSFWS